MTIVIANTPITDGLIGYDNHLESGVITATSEAVGFEGVNAATWTTFDKWRTLGVGTHYLKCSLTGAKISDYWALFGHDLGAANATVSLEYSTDGGVVWSFADGPIAPGGTQCVFRRFSSIVAQDWRIKVVSQVATSIAVVAIGFALVLPHRFRKGFAPPMRNDYKEVTHGSEKGLFLGRSVIDAAVDVQLKMGRLDEQWLRSSWLPFELHARSKPFFLSWDSQRFPWEAAYCWSSGRQRGAARYTHATLSEVSMRAKGLIQ